MAHICGRVTHHRMLGSTAPFVGRSLPARDAMGFLVRCLPALRAGFATVVQRGDGTNALATGRNDRAAGRRRALARMCAGETCRAVVARERANDADVDRAAGATSSRSP